MTELGKDLTRASVHVNNLDLNKEGFKPSKAMQSAAARGLMLRAKYERGGLDTREAGQEGISSGVARARDIINGKNLSIDTIKQMKAFFDRHEKNYQPDKRESDGGQTAGTIAWYLWGGDSGREWANSIIEQQEVSKSFTVQGKILKAADDEERMVYGWAYINSIKGKPVIDSQGDVIDDDELKRMAREFIKNSRNSKVMHEGKVTGEVVESIVLTESLQKEFSKTGLLVDFGCGGWLVGIKIYDNTTWELIKQGKLPAFSIGGKAKRVEINGD